MDRLFGHAAVLGAIVAVACAGPAERAAPTPSAAAALASSAAPTVVLTTPPSSPSFTPAPSLAARPSAGSTVSAPPSVSPGSVPLLTATPTASPAAVSTAAPTTSPTDAPAVSTGRTVETIGTRHGVTLSFMLDVPSRPAGVLVMFVGSDGRGAFFGRGAQAVPGPNFLARSTSEFTSRGLAVALVDVPSDQTGGISVAFRSSAQHLEDITQLVTWLGARGFGAIHLVGTSRGSISAAFVGSSLDDPRVSRVVLTSSVREVGDLPLDRLRRPTLFVHNRDDACGSSPFNGARSMSQRVSGAAFVEARGGSSQSSLLPLSGPCDPYSRHGYFTIESPVAGAIVDWIAGRTPAAVVP